MFLSKSVTENKEIEKTKRNFEDSGYILNGSATFPLKIGKTLVRSPLQQAYL
jgi:hypothetical protein